MNSRVFPMSPRCEVSPIFQQNKVVDRANPNAKFARRSPSRVNESTLGGDLSGRTSGSATPSRGRSRSNTPSNANPFESIPAEQRSGLRHTGMENFQQERALYREMNPRSVRRSVSPMYRPDPSPHTMYTMTGLASNGGKANKVFLNSKVFPDGASPAPAYVPGDRFRNTQFKNTTVLNPERSLEPAGAAASSTRMARFSEKYRQPSLVGVLQPVSERQPASYRVRTPWFSED